MELKNLRTALFGFNKNDVCEYIAELNHIYEQKEEQKNKDKREAMKELNRKNEELNDCSSRLNQENTELKRVNDELRKKLALADADMESMKFQLKEIQKAVASAMEAVGEQGHE